MLDRRYTPRGRPFVTSAVTTPLTARPFTPLKNAKRVGSNGVTWSIALSSSITTWVCPIMLPCALTLREREKRPSQQNHHSKPYKKNLQNSLLRRRIVIILRIHKATRLKVPNRHLDRKRLVRTYSTKVLRVHKLAARHVRSTSDNTDWSWVT